MAFEGIGWSNLCSPCTTLHYPHSREDCLIMRSGRVCFAEDRVDGLLDGGSITAYLTSQVRSSNGSQAADRRLDICFLPIL